MEKPLSGLAYIKVDSSNPFRLFSEWKREAEESGHLAPYVMNLATCTRDCKVSNRNVAILKFDTDSFTFLTTKRGEKIKAINENPNVASTFLWIYRKEDRCITRQIRIEGNLEEVAQTLTEEIYNQMPIYAKIRSNICVQNEPIQWQILKDRHDRFLEGITRTDEELTMPEEMIAFKLLPERMDFYYAYDNFIADRVKFVKSEDGSWEYHHVQA